MGRDLYNVEVTSEVLDLTMETLGAVQQEHVRFRLDIKPLDAPNSKPDVPLQAPYPGDGLMTWDVGKYLRTVSWSF